MIDRYEFRKSKKRVKRHRDAFQEKGGSGLNDKQ